MAPRFVCSSCSRHTHRVTYCLLQYWIGRNSWGTVSASCCFVAFLYSTLPFHLKLSLHSTGAPKAGSTSPLTTNPDALGPCLVLRRSSPPSLAHPTPPPTSLALPTPSAAAASTLSSRRRAPPLRIQHLSFTQLLPPLCYRDTVLIPFADAKATFAVPRAPLVPRTDAVPPPSSLIIEDCNAPSLSSQLLAPCILCHVRLFLK
jgi:hypothetical protein